MAALCHFMLCLRREPEGPPARAQTRIARPRKVLMSRPSGRDTSSGARLSYSMPKTLQ